MSYHVSIVDVPHNLAFIPYMVQVYIFAHQALCPSPNPFRGTLRLDDVSLRFESEICGSCSTGLLGNSSFPCLLDILFFSFRVLFECHCQQFCYGLLFRFRIPSKIQWRYSLKAVLYFDSVTSESEVLKLGFLLVAKSTRQVVGWRGLNVVRFERLIPFVSWLDRRVVAPYGTLPHYRLPNGDQEFVSSPFRDVVGLGLSYCTASMSGPLHNPKIWCTVFQTIS